MSSTPPPEPAAETSEESSTPPAEPAGPTEPTERAEPTAETPANVMANMPGIAPVEEGVMARLTAWRSTPTARRWSIALLVYFVALVVFAIVAGPERLRQHTAFNHYALLAEAWLHGHQWVVHGGPQYAQGNDFAEFEGKTYISFPPFPALLMLPLVALAGSAENFRDGQFIIWLAGLGPAFLFLVLEKLRRTGRSPRTEKENLALALIFAFGTVYFFTAVEGTVWFAALVVGVAVQTLFLLFAMDAEHPLLAGIVLGCAFMTRPTMILLSFYFAFEAWRVSLRAKSAATTTDVAGLNPASTETATATGTLDEGTTGSPPAAPAALADLWRRVDTAALLQRVTLFALPVAAALVLAATMNHARFHTWNPNAFGHEYLTVQWRGRMEKWGLFGWHYLAKNLGVSLTILPWLPPHGESCFNLPDSTPLYILARFQECVPFRVNEHGLALWWTTPLYLWLLRPGPRSGGPAGSMWQYRALLASAAVIAGMDLMYQNSGWRQFGFRFSNDFAPVLFLMLAMSVKNMKSFAFRTAAVWAIAWNLFGAVTFDRGDWDRFYFREGTQQILYQAD